MSQAISSDFVLYHVDGINQPAKEFGFEKLPDRQKRDTQTADSDLNDDDGIELSFNDTTAENVTLVRELEG